MGKLSKKVSPVMHLMRIYFLLRHGIVRRLIDKEHGMETRRFGRTNHESTLAIFGAAAFYDVSQKQADQAMELVISSGINHIDVAPSYGQAEMRLGPWMETERERFFLGCKTKARTKKGAHDELRRSLDLLKTTSFDLYQFHDVGSIGNLDQITGKGGALEAVLEARDEGLIKYIGITGHGLGIPDIHLEALRRFDFDSVLFPINFILYANPDYRKSAEELLAQCAKRNVGIMAIKSIARGPWGEGQITNTTWYRPFTEESWIRKCVDFVLSQPVSGICTSGDISLLPGILDACNKFKKVSIQGQKELISQADKFEPLFE
jgi:aryl-alcohol dehydrogenase-like predicted oxidoreductase